MVIQTFDRYCISYSLTTHITSFSYLNFIVPYIYFNFQVGKETINSSDDALLKQDMPAALQRVEGASRLLEEASAMLKEDPYSGPAR